MNDKVILITGGTGSFGKKCTEILFKNFKPQKVIVFSRDELKQFEMQQSSEFHDEHDIIRYFLGDIRDLPRLQRAMEGVDYVVHTAALKQVPAAEYNPFEAIKTNIIGAQNVIEAAFNARAKKILALSTDKAAAPVNLYGATKLASDKLFIAANNFRGKHDIRFSVVRYGNVLGSRGSVIPIFQQKSKEGVLPITHEKMTRFTITYQESIDFVLECLDMMWGGELFVPKSPSFRILDVAKAIAPECEIKVVGIRPGEKIHEEMITEADSLNTYEFDRFYVIAPHTTYIDLNAFFHESYMKEGIKVEEGFRYFSGENDHWLSVEDIRSLVESGLA